MSINSPIPVIFFDEEDDLGQPLANGKLYAYYAGTSTPRNTYSEPTGTTLNAHPIILNSAGRCSVWLEEGGAYKWILKDKDDNVIWTKDNVGFINLSGTSSYAASISALRDVPVGQSDFATVVMTGSNALSYAWDEFSTAGDNGYSIILSTSAPSIGRWVLKSDQTISSSVFTNLADAILKIGITPTTITISKTETLTADLIVPANITLKVLHGGSIAGAFTLTMNGILESDEINIIAAATTVIFGAAGIHTIKSRWFNTFALAIASCGSSNVVLEHSTAMSITNHLTIPSNVTLRIMNSGATLDVGNTLTLTIYGNVEADRISVFTGLGTVKFGNGSVDYICPEWFGVDSSSPDNTAAFQKAVTATNNSTGFSPGIIKVAAGEFTLTGTLTLPDNIILEGAGCNQSVLKHNPSTFINLIEGNGVYGIIIRDLGLKGRTTTTGNSKYLIRLTNLNVNSYLSNLHLSNSVGYIYIQNGSQSQMSNITCDDSTPTPADAGLSDANWELVYGETTAPIYLGGMTSSVITDLKINNVGSIVNGSFGNPTSVFRMINSDATIINGLTITECYNNGSDDLLSDYMASFVDCAGCSLNGLIFVNDHAVVSQLYFDRDCSFTIDGFDLITVESQFIVKSTSIHDITINGLSVIDSQIESNSWVPQSGFSLNSKVYWTNSSVAIGKGYTDVTVSGDSLNVTDTVQFGASYREGISDYANNAALFRSITPKSNLIGAITTGSNPTYSGVDPSLTLGNYLQVTSGTFRSEQNVLHQIKRPTSGSTQCVFRLRPQTNSTYYRLYVSETGSLYLVSNGISQFTSDLGNWIIQFYVNGSGAIKNYYDGVSAIDGTCLNQRTLYDGQYTGGSSLVSMLYSAAPSSGYWTAGDIFTNSEPLANEPFGWRCILTGEPGTWETMTYVNTAAPITLVDVTTDKLTLTDNVDGEFHAATLTNEFQTAGSSDESIVSKYYLRGGNSASDKLAANLRISKEGTFDDAPTSDSKIVLEPVLNGSAVPTFEASGIYGSRHLGRVQGPIGTFVTGDAITLTASNVYRATGGFQNMYTISSTGWLDGSIITIIFAISEPSVNIIHGTAPSGAYKGFWLERNAVTGNITAKNNDVFQFILDGNYWRLIGPR